MKNGLPNTRLNQIKQLFGLKEDKEVWELIRKTIETGVKKQYKKYPTITNYILTANGKRIIVGVDKRGVIRTVIGEKI